MNKKIVILLKVVVSLGLITLLVNQVDFNKIVNILKNVDITMIIYALILLIIQVFIATTRWQYVLKCQKIMLDYKNTLQICGQVYFLIKQCHLVWVEMWSEVII